MTDTKADQVRSDLSEILDLAVELSHYLIPGSAPADVDVQTSSAHAPSVINEQVVDLLDFRDKGADDPLQVRSGDGFRVGVFPLLGMWSSLVQAELIDLGREVPPCCPRSGHVLDGEGNRHTLAGEIVWLSEHAGTVIELHRDFPAEITRVRNELRRACRIRPVYEPRCSTCGWAMEPQEGDDTAEGVAPAWWRCTGCERTVVHDAEVKRLAATQPPMTLRQIHALTRIPLRTLHNWRSDKRFLPVGVNGRGGELFELGLVERAAKSVAKTPRRKGRAS